MKRIISSLFALLISTAAFAQLDRSVRPEPAPAKDIKFGEYKIYELDNGLKIIVVENDKLPRVSFSLVVDRNPIVEGDKAGYVSIAGSLLRQGTTNRSKDQLDEEVDFIGARLFTGSSNVFASGLSKYEDEIVELLADVALNPAFPEEEFEKLKKQSLSGIESAKEDPSTLSSRLVNRSLYGAEHPYGELETEESLNKITLEDCKNYYNTYWAPNNTYITVVGDISPRKAKKLIKKHFGDWQRKEVPTSDYAAVPTYNGTEVKIINRNSSVQTVLEIANTIDLKPGHEDAVKMRLVNQILGGGSIGRLFKNIREDKGYTYGAYSSYDTDRLVGSFSASASVRTEVTDSAVMEFIKEFKRLQNEPVSAEELQAAKNFIIGTFGTSLESPQTIARFALNIERYGLPKDYYESYLKKLDALNAEDVMATAKKYIKADQLVITAVGKGSEIISDLEVFGPVKFYDFNGEETGPPSLPVPDGMTAADVINKYVEALGGKEALDGVKDLKITSNVSISGMPMQATSVEMRKRPNLYFNEMSIGGMGVVQKTVYDGKKAVTGGMQGKQELEGEQIDALKDRITFFAETQYEEMGYKLNLASVNLVDGEKAYLIELDKGDGNISSEYYSVETGLKIKEEASVEGPQGPMTVGQSIGDYREVNGVKFPHSIKISGPQSVTIEVQEVLVNTKIKKSAFSYE